MFNFPTRLKEIRAQKKFSQKQVAEGINVSESLYQKYEYGKNKPSYDVIIRLCTFFDISADYMLGLSDDMKINK